MIKTSILEVITGWITKNESAKKFLETIERLSAKNDKVETTSALFSCRKNMDSSRG